MENTFGIVRKKPWLVFGILVAAGTICALIELQHPTAALFMAAGVLVMWQSGAAARPEE